MCPQRPSDPPGSDGKPLRRYPRLPVEGVSGGFVHSSNARILNMSLDGMALETSDYLQVGRSYSLKLSHENEEVVLRGRVVWCRMVGTEQQKDGGTAPIYSAGLHLDDLFSGKAGEVHRFLRSNAVISLEQRMFGRFRLHRSETADVDHQASFRVETISLNGMQVDSDTFVEPGTALDLEMRIGGQSLTTSGRVAHSKRLEPQPGVESASRLGIEFLELSEEAEEAIKSLIRTAIR